jgi:hypothetical protein
MVLQSLIPYESMRIDVLLNRCPVMPIDSDFCVSNCIRLVRLVGDWACMLDFAYRYQSGCVLPIGWLSLSQLINLDLIVVCMDMISFLTLMVSE